MTNGISSRLVNISRSNTKTKQSPGAAVAGEEGEKMACSNAERDAVTGALKCKATGYCCRYVPANRAKRNQPCLFEPIFEKNEQIQRMLESIRAVQMGSKVTTIYKINHGFYVREALDSSRGTILEIDKYGCMKAEFEKLKGIWHFFPEDFTRTLFLSKKEFERKREELEEQMEEQERIKAERREEDGRTDAQDITETM